MRERFSYQEALARTKIRLGLSDVQTLLNEAISSGVVGAHFPGTPDAPEPAVAEGEIFRDAVNLYAGGLTYVDLEYDPLFKTEGASPEWVDGPDLERWLDELTSATTPQEETPPEEQAGAQYRSGLPGRPNSK